MSEDQLGWDAPPDGARLLSDLLVSHPAMIRIVTQAAARVGADVGHFEFGGLLIHGPKIPGAIDPDRWQAILSVDGFSAKFPIFSEEYAEFGQFGPKQDFLPWRLPESSGNGHPLWDLIGEAWSQSLRELLFLIREDEVRLEGRIGQIDAVGRPIKLDWLSRSFWLGEGIDFDRSTITLADGQTAYSVHIVRPNVVAGDSEPSQPANKRAVRAAARKNLESRIKASPLRKTITKKDFIAEWAGKVESRSGPRTIWDQVTQAISDPKSKGVWRTPGPLKAD